jgi:hypothetical protein
VGRYIFLPKWKVCIFFSFSKRAKRSKKFCYHVFIASKALDERCLLLILLSQCSSTATSKSVMCAVFFTLKLGMNDNRTLYHESIEQKMERFCKFSNVSTLRVIVGIKYLVLKFSVGKFLP